MTTASDTKYVRLFNVRRGRGRNERIETRLACVTDPYYDPWQDYATQQCIAVFEVRSVPNADAAVGAVAEWLYKDRPDLMMVRQITSRTPRPEAATTADDGSKGGAS